MFVKEFSEFEKGWLAGVIDSEGCINYRIRGDNYSIQVYNTNIKFIRRFAEIVGYRGKIYVANTNNKRLAKKKLFSINISNGQQVIGILSQIKDSLMVRRKEAVKAIRNKMNKKQYRLKRLSSEYEREENNVLLQPLLFDRGAG